LCTSDDLKFKLSPDIVAGTNLMLDMKEESLNIIDEQYIIEIDIFNEKLNSRFKDYQTSQE